MKKNIIILIFAILPFWGCNMFKNPKLEVMFHVNEKKNIVPSYQIAIWLEKPNGDYVKTLFVCDYLSFGGYSISGICPTWTGKTKWDKTPKEEVDAVTQATPDIGDAIFEFECPENEVPNGVYKYNIEIHITEEFNELYSGDIVISDDKYDSVGDIKTIYIPKKYPKANGLLSNVKVRFKN